MRVRLVGLAAIVALMSSTPGLAQLQAENLLAGVPEGFEVGYHASQNGMIIAEFVPKGETVEAWSRMITVQVFRGLRNADGDQLASNMQQGWEAACTGSDVGRDDAGKVNGYDWVAWHFSCPMNPETNLPETMWLRAVSGADALYVVQYAYRALPSVEREGPATEYLSTISVCDTRRADRPCPEGM